ncbi:transcriptional regulator with XRE-family HTH domain [Pseudomonas sp. JAI111]|jgi:transcriptional regulator with XRE-family HTH domain|uniref:helix-turn-helix domain-containing protein n=1 Tax=Pseudomonas sp. JAI111 TaxID=2735913 RepID=UPI0021676384|nr:helix-turn-helix transcriptional regulator [Pseudomonas sp. JAI111]MCS3837729.1 transcriptional regulator with XRE-family HTH domain [Pseudomonas sp. JAI111]
MALTHILYSPGEIALQIAGNAKRLRLSKNLSRRTLAQKSGVPESNIKRFETTGKISLDGLLLIAICLGAEEPLTNLFASAQSLTLQELKNYERARGRQ